MEVETISILQILLSIIAITVTAYATPRLIHRAILMWRWRRVKKAGANYFKCMNDYFSSLPPRGSEFCKDCRYSEVSINNGNLICLHERSRHFGETVAPEQDKTGFCYFERKE